MSNDHTPDPRFVDFLEWELKTTMRRQESLNRAPCAARLVKSRVGTALALVVMSLFAGGAGTYAAIHRIDGEAAALHIARGEAILEIARTRLEPVAKELARLQALVQQGTATEAQLHQVEASFLHAQSEVEIRELDLAETRVTGKAPDDALSAPLVSGRDFVTERLAARRRPMQRRIELMAEQSRRNEQLIGAGLASAGELEGGQMQVAGAGEEWAELEKRIALRKSFLAGELSPTAVELEGMRIATVFARGMALRQVEVLTEQHKRLSQLSERGMVPDSELQAIKAELRAVEARAELANLELRILDQKIENAPKE